MGDLVEQANLKLEETGYMRKIRAQMKKEVLKTTLEMEENGELPENIQIKRFKPNDDESNALSYIAEFLNYHGLENSLECLKLETNGHVHTLRSGPMHSEIAGLVGMYNYEMDNKQHEE